MTRSIHKGFVMKTLYRTLALGLMAAIGCSLYIFFVSQGMERLLAAMLSSLLTAGILKMTTSHW